MKPRAKFDPYHGYHANFGLGRLAEKRGEEEAVIAFYYLQIEAAYDEWGSDACVSLEAVTHLADYLRILEREEEAVVVESRMMLTDEFTKVALD